MPDYFDTIQRLLKYEAWCNATAMDALAGLSDIELQQDFGFGLRTPHHTMSHIADVMQGWGGCVGPKIRQPVWLPYDDSETLDALRDRLAATGASLLAALRESHEMGVLDNERRLHQALHLVTHGTHHRAQLLAMLKQLGRPQPFEGGDFGGWSNHPSE